MVLEAPGYCTQTFVLHDREFVDDLDFFTPFGVCHAADPEAMAGPTTAVYTCLALKNVAPKVEVDIFDNVMDCLTILSCDFRSFMLL